MIFYLHNGYTGEIKQVDVGSESEAHVCAHALMRSIEREHGARNARVVVTRLYEILEVSK